MFDKKQVELQHKILKELEEMNCRINRLLGILEFIIIKLTFPSHFTIKETSMQQPLPGATLQFTATPQPDGSSLNGVVPSWTSSDTTNISITPDAAGLVVEVTIGAAVQIGESVTLTISATDPATGNVAIGEVSFTVGQAPPPPTPFPTSFSIAQTA